MSLSDTSIGFQLGLLCVLIFVSALFSASETAMMSVNRYKMKHLAQKSKRAQVVVELLKRPDRLLGMILIGNTFANIFASAVATLIAVQLLEDDDILLPSIMLTIVLLIFGEVTPKTFAALHSERTSKAVVPLLYILIKLFYPLVVIVNAISNGIIRLLGIKTNAHSDDGLSGEELRTVVFEATGRLSRHRRSMLLGVLDLEHATIDDIMIPRNEIVGIDLDDDWDAILGQLANCQHTFLPVYKHDIDNVVGILHVRDALNLMASESFDKKQLTECLRIIFYSPLGCKLPQQLMQFRKHKQRVSIVVNEYGDVQGLITLVDILEEIVGDFTTDVADASKDVHPQTDGSFIVNGTTFIRDLNKEHDWDLPTDGAKTLSGLIIEYLEEIPNVGSCVMLGGWPIEVLQVKDNVIRSLKVGPRRDSKK